MSGRLAGLNRYFPLASGRMLCVSKLKPVKSAGTSKPGTFEAATVTVTGDCASAAPPKREPRQPRLRIIFILSMNVFLCPTLWRFPTLE